MKQYVKDYLDPINSEDMPFKMDALFSLDFLLAAKNGVRNCAYALSETASPDARTIVRNQLEEALTLHNEISQLMIDKGWLHAYDLNEQFQLDKISAQNIVQIAGMQLFPKDTSRIGTFATPDK